MDAALAIKRLHENVERHNESNAGEPPLALSLGTADWEPSSEETLDELMKRADSEMYVHKRSKRQ